jgi:hypothetical protein
MNRHLRRSPGNILSVLQRQMVTVQRDFSHFQPFPQSAVGFRLFILGTLAHVKAFFLFDVRSGGKI